MKKITKKIKVQATGERRKEQKMPFKDFELVFKKNPVPMIISTMEGIILNVNEAFEKESGFDFNGISGKSATEIGFLSSKVNSKAIKQHKASKRIEGFEAKFKTKNAENKTGHFSVITIKYDGRTCLLTALTNVTAQKKVVESAGLTQYMFDHSVEATLWTDLEENIVYVNEAACRLYGYSKEMFLTKKVSDIDVKIVGDELFDFRMRLRKHKVVFFETTHRKKDGTEFLVEVNGSIVEFAGRGYFCCFIRDVTERKINEEALKRSEEKFSKAFMATPAGIAITRLNDGNILHINEETSRILGYEVGEEHGRTTLGMQIWKDAEERNNVVRMLMKDGVVRDLEVTFRRKDGQERLLRYSAMIIEIAGDACAISSYVDITEQKKAEEALKKSEEKFSKAFMASPAGNAITRLSDGTILQMNDEAWRILGFRREEAEGKTTPGLGIWADPEERNKVVRMLFNDGIVRDLDIKFRRKDDEVLNVRYAGALMELENDNYAISSFVDITDQRRAENQLRSSQILMDTTINAFNEWIHVCDEDLKIVLVNEALSSVAETLGYSNDIIGAGVSELFPFLSKAIEEQYRDIFKTGRTLITEERQLFKGGIIDVEVIKTPVFEKGRVVRVITMLRDITERKRAETALKDSEERFRSLVENTPFGVFVHIDGKIVYCNPSGLKIFKFNEQKEILGYPLLELVHQAHKHIHEESIGALNFNESRVPIHEIKIVKKDGEQGYLELFSINSSYQGGKAIFTFFSDITERKRMDEELGQYQEQLQQLATRFAATEVFERKRIATELHDNVGQSLALIRMRLDLLTNSTNDESVKEGMADVCRSIDRTMEYARNLTTDLYPPVLRQIGLDAAVESIGENLQKHHGIQFKLTHSGSIRNIEVETKELLYRTVRELMLNVAKHSGATGMEVVIRVKKSDISIIVSDDGKGFDTEHLGLLTKKGRFGLFSVKELVSAMGGNVSITSTPGKGTCVTVSVPREKPTGSEA